MSILYTKNLPGKNNYRNDVEKYKTSKIKKDTQCRAYFHGAYIALVPGNISYTVFSKYLWAILQVLNLHTSVYKHTKKQFFSML